MKNIISILLIAFSTSLFGQVIVIPPSGSGSAFTPGTGSGSSAPTEVTYDELATAIEGSSLTPGGWYLLTDFQTVHYFTDDGSTIVEPTILYYNDSVVSTDWSYQDSVTITHSGFIPYSYEFCNQYYLTNGITATFYHSEGDDSRIVDSVYMIGNTQYIRFYWDELGIQAWDSVKFFVEGLENVISNINVGETEPLLLLATSDSTIDNHVYSPTFPQDVIHYDWNPENWLQDVSFSADQFTIVEGWKGIITYRWDTKQDNSTGYDFRNVKFRRWALNPEEWSSEIEYGSGEYCQFEGFMFVSKQVATDKNPNDSTDYWSRLYDLSDNPYFSWSSVFIFDIFTNSNDFVDLYTWESYETNYGNHIGISFDSRLNNIVFGQNSHNNTFSNNCYNMTFNDECVYISGRNCYYLIFGRECHIISIKENAFILFPNACTLININPSVDYLIFPFESRNITINSYVSEINLTTIDDMNTNYSKTILLNSNGIPVIQYINDTPELVIEQIPN